MSKVEVLQKVGRNPHSVAPWDPRADEMIPLNGISHERRGCADDNGMWLGDAMHWELQRVAACALANAGTASIIIDDHSNLVVNLSVAGYGGMARWSGRNKGYLCGGRLFLLDDARQRVQGKPGLDTVDGNVVRGNALDPRKVVVEKPRRVNVHHGTVVHHHHHAPEHRVYGQPSQQRVAVQERQLVAAAFQKIR